MPLCDDCPIRHHVNLISESDYRKEGLFSEKGDLTQEELSYLEKVLRPGLYASFVVVTRSYNVESNLDIQYQALSNISRCISGIMDILGGKLPKKIADLMRLNMECCDSGEGKPILKYFPQEDDRTALKAALQALALLPDPILAELRIERIPSGSASTN